MTQQKPMTAEEVQARMISLHHELTNFEYYLRMNSGTVPPMTPKEDAGAIAHVQELLERETRRMGIVIKNKNLDTMVENSLKAAGCEPDQPKDEPTANDSN